MFYSGAEALEASIAAVSKYGGASAGYRTLLDALIPASAILLEVPLIIIICHCNQSDLKGVVIY